MKFKPGAKLCLKLIDVCCAVSGKVGLDYTQEVGYPVSLAGVPWSAWNFVLVSPLPIGHFQSAPPLSGCNNCKFSEFAVH